MSRGNACTPELPVRVTVSPRGPVVVRSELAASVVVFEDDACSLRLDLGALSDEARVYVARALVVAGEEIADRQLRCASDEWPSVANSGASTHYVDGVSPGFHDHSVPGAAYE